jgi:hypothetical protein
MPRPKRRYHHMTELRTDLRYGREPSFGNLI